MEQDIDLINNEIDTSKSQGLLDTTADSVLAMAEKAERMLEAMNKIMTAALKITSEKD